MSFNKGDRVIVRDGHTQEYLAEVKEVGMLILGDRFLSVLPLEPVRLKSGETLVQEIVVRVSASECRRASLQEQLDHGVAASGKYFSIPAEGGSKRAGRFFSIPEDE
jgi:hypothetical protein